MNADSYSAKQKQHDAEYRREYEAWVKTLSRRERRELKAQGIHVPFLPGVAGGMSDAASSSRARCEAEEIDEEDDQRDEEDLDHLSEPSSLGHQAPQSADKGQYAGTRLDAESIHDLLRRLVGELISQDQSKLSLECLALVTGLVYHGSSMTSIARKYGVTRAAVSKRCVELTQALNLNPSRAMRTRKARQSYRSSRTSHLRHTA